jgi:DNA modification methylase
MKLSQIKANPNNPRLIKDERFAKLCKSIQDAPKFMALRPIIIDGEGMILGGNMRYKALLHLGYKEVPDAWVKRADELTEDEKKRFIIADNVGFGDWDYEALANEWDAEQLSDWGLDVPDFEVVPTEAKEDNYEIPETLSTDIVLGDLFEIGPHRLLCGDSADSDQVIRLMNNDKADMVFTDPPYGVAYTGGTKDALTIQNDNVSEQQLSELVTAWFSCVDLAARDGAYLLATVPPGPLHLIFAQDWKSRGWLRQIMVWNKSALVMGHSEYHYKHEPILFGWKEGKRLKNTDRTKTTVWDFDKPSANREHPTMKPVEMWAYGIKNHTEIGNLLFEPFGGSGTCFVAAHQLGRRCYGMELDPKYCQVIIDRMMKLDPTLEIKRNGQPYKKTGV